MRQYGPSRLCAANQGLTEYLRLGPGLRSPPAGFSHLDRQNLLERSLLETCWPIETRRFCVHKCQPQLSRGMKLLGADMNQTAHVDQRHLLAAAGRAALSRLEALDWRGIAAFGLPFI